MNKTLNPFINSLEDLDDRELILRKVVEKYEELGQNAQARVFEAYYQKLGLLSSP